MSLLVDFDFTIDADTITAANLKERLEEICKKGSFQKEEGLTGYIHFQGRCKMKKKIRLSTLTNQSKKGFLRGIHWSITSNANRNNYDYVNKEWTRIGEIFDLHKVLPFIPRQVSEIKKLRPFQQTIIEKMTEWDTRHINVVVNPLGEVGKTILKSWCRSKKIAITIPASNDYRDIMRMIMCKIRSGGTNNHRFIPSNENNNLIVDMPKAMKKTHLSGFYTGIETIKDGYAYDDRYKFTDTEFNSPNIWVFTNTMPDISLLTASRWVLWKVTNEFKLIPYE